MAAETDGYTNQWPEAVVNFYLKTTGLKNENPSLVKYLSISHHTLLTLVFILICQQLSGIAIRLAGGNFTLAQITIPLIYGIFVGGTLLVETYAIHYRATVTARCVKKSTGKLNCLSYVDEAKIRHEHMPLFKFFLLVYVWFVYASALLRTVFSPVMRFGFKIGASSYVVSPIWYPFDVFSSRILFWIAFLYETVLHWFAIHALCNNNVVFLYVFTTARVRLDALNKFLREITSDIEQQSPKRRELKSKTHSKKSIASCASNGINASQVNLKRLKQGIEDMFKLRRQAQLINSTFKVYFTASHFVTFAIISLMAFAGTVELRGSNKKLIEKIPHSIFFFFVAIASVGQIFTVCYNTTTLQDAYDDLRFSLWSSDWYAEKNEFKKLFILAKSVLNQPLTMKAYTYYPLNLRTFNSSLKESWVFFLFLYQLTAPK